MPTAEATARRDMLARVPAFSGLSERVLEELAAATHLRRLAPREELCHKGDEGTQVYVILSGRLRVTTTSADGSDVHFAIMNPGEVCGELALFAGGERTATITAVDACEVLTLDRRDFLPAMRKNPELAIQLVEALAQRLRRISEQMEDTVFLGLPARLAKQLLSLADAYGKPVEDGVRIELKLSQQELGTMVGRTRESVNKQMRAWEEAGIARTDRGIITILDRRRLEDVAGLLEL